MDPETLYREAMALDAADEYGRSALLYKKLVANSEDPRHFVAYGVCLPRLGHWKESVAPLERGVELPLMSNVRQRAHDHAYILQIQLGEPK